METTMPINRNPMFLIIGALIVVEDDKDPKGLQINVGPNGLKIENK